MVKKIVIVMIAVVTVVAATLIGIGSRRRYIPAEEREWGN